MNDADPPRAAAPDEPERAGHDEQRTYSPQAVRKDRTYAGRAGGYGPAGTGAPGDEGGSPDGEGTYGFPHGVGVGDTGGRHPDDEALDPPPPYADEVDLDPGPGDHFGAGRHKVWKGAPDPGGRGAELQAHRSRAAPAPVDDHAGDETSRQGPGGGTPADR